MDIILKALPHRYPFLFVDKVLDLKEDEIVVKKSVTINEWFFVGHFPGNPIMPGVIIIEAIAQAAGVLFLHDFEDKDNYLPVLSVINEFKFKKSVKPGDDLIIKVKKEKIKKIGQVIFPMVKAEAYVDKSLVAYGNLTFAITPKK
ncbi:MAG: 3-hydroxyacyl-ACP dehydratase FabZ [bacterium]|jgi:beta-hydroxyacyl-ACP dehydratase FabZ